MTTLEAEVIDVEAAPPRTAALPAQRQSSALAATVTPGDLLRIAVEKGADLDYLGKLMDLQERWEANEARKAFVAAMAAFKAEPVKILKNKQVYFQSQKGVTNYWHAELSDVTNAVGPAMAKHGLTFDWDVHQQSGKIVVDCVVTHSMGHFKKVTMEGPLDATGNKNAIQQAGSTVTYLQRYTLLSAIGMATQGADDDGNDGAPDNGSQQPAASQCQAEPEFYPQERFEANKAAWRETITSGKKTPAQIIATVQSKGALLTDAQKNTIDSWAHEND